MRETNHSTVTPRERASEAGFSLIEMLVTAIVFSLVVGTALALLARHQPLYKQQQNRAALNISMRNAVAQMQTDMVGGGAGYYTGINIPNWPVGVVINNNVVASGGDCHSGTTYGSNCFDSLTVIASDPATTPVNTLAGASGTLPVAAGSCASNTLDTSATTSIYVLPPTGVTAATYAASFHTGDQVLLVKSDGSKYTTVKVTGISTPTVGVSTYVLLAHSTMTQSNGTNASADDITGMSVNSSDQTTSQFCAADWLVRLAPVKYDVDITTDPTNPTLRRTVLVAGNTPSTSGVALMNQVIGFKVGAALVDNTGSTDVATYNFDSSTFKLTGAAAGYDYTMVRSVMVSLIGRTSPQLEPTYVYRNAFDGGPYQIEGISVVINPRNMSM